MDRAKPYDIPKSEVWEAYKRVRANQGRAGADGQMISDFEADLENNLYKLWFHRLELPRWKMSGCALEEGSTFLGRPSFGRRSLHGRGLDRPMPSTSRHPNSSQRRRR